MIVMTSGGSRLLHVEEMRVIPWVLDTRDSKNNHIPVDTFGWTASISESRWRWAVSAIKGLNRSSAVQLSRMCKTYEEADLLFKAYASSLKATFFYDENMERKSEKAGVESTSKAKALSSQTAEMTVDRDKDAVVTAVEG